jgi:hypothetical protein
LCAQPTGFSIEAAFSEAIRTARQQKSASLLKRAEASDTLAVVVTTNHVAFPSKQILLGDNLHAGDRVIEQFVGPFDFDDASFVTVTYSILNGVSGSDADAVAFKIAGVVLATFAGLEEAKFAGLVASKLETGILAVAAGVAEGIGEFLGISPSNPDCHGPVATRVTAFSSGQLNGACY